jgi:deazaflavin-dependent oxidoreductase (nitroreductase family)
MPLGNVAHVHATTNSSRPNVNIPLPPTALRSTRQPVPMRQARPGGALRTWLRLPVGLYHRRLGFLLGRRFLLLVHRGRRSGMVRETVLEVIHHDPSNGEFVVVAAWGDRSDWLRNIRTEPALAVMTGGRRFVPEQRFLSPEEGMRVLARYGRAHPFAWSAITSLFGWSGETDKDNLTRLALEHPLVAFRSAAGNAPPTAASYSQEPVDKADFTRSFDRTYSHFAHAYDVAVKVLPVWRLWLRRALPHIKGQRVLEISFGTGWLLTQFASRFDTHGVELNEKMVTIAYHNLERAGLTAALVQGNVEALPYPDECFDTIVNTMAFTGYPDAGKAMAELHRVLRPGGRVVMIDVNHPADGNRIGNVLVWTWERLGDLIRNMRPLFEDFRLDVTSSEIGGWGSIHLYIAEKP